MRRIATVIVIAAFFNGAWLFALGGRALNSSARQPAAQTGESHAPDTQTAASDADHVYDVGHGVSAPKLTYSVDPQFSEAGRRHKLSGMCTVESVIDALGTPRNVHVTRSIAEDLSKKNQKYAAGMDAKAVEAVEQYRFSPSMREGKRVPVLIHIEVSFRIY